MLTSESKGYEFRSFLLRNEGELVRRVSVLLGKKYRRTLIPILKRGDEIPKIYGTLKLDNDITLYGQVQEVIFKKETVDFTLGFFLIMKDLREQTRIMITMHRDSDDYGIMFSTHAISRYKERLRLNPDMDFVDVCKHMFEVGKCGTTGIFNQADQVYGTNPNNRKTTFVCVNGVFMGYFSLETEMYHAETFLTPNELREDQNHLNPEIETLHKHHQELVRLYEKGQLPKHVIEDITKVKGYVVEDGKLRFMSSEEELENMQEFEKLQKDNPEYFNELAQDNRSKAEDRIKRKGYK